MRKAVRLLERGLRDAPQAWQLWQLLGKYSSDEKRFARAYCYERALACDGVDASSVQLNYAIALNRDEQHDEAIAAARAGLDGSTPDEADDRRWLHNVVARALWAKGENDAALRACWEAVAILPTNGDVMWLIGEIESQYSKSASEYEVGLQGEWSKPFDDGVQAHAFRVSYNVIADDPDGDE